MIRVNRPSKNRSKKPLKRQKNSKKRFKNCEKTIKKGDQKFREVISA